MRQVMKVGCEEASRSTSGAPSASNLVGGSLASSRAWAWVRRAWSAMFPLTLKVLSGQLLWLGGGVVLQVVTAVATDGWQVPKGQAARPCSVERCTRRRLRALRCHSILLLRWGLWCWRWLWTCWSAQMAVLQVGCKARWSISHLARHHHEHLVATTVFLTSLACLRGGGAAMGGGGAWCLESLGVGQLG